MFYRVKNLFEMSLGQDMKSRPKNSVGHSIFYLVLEWGCVSFTFTLFFSTVWENFESDIVFLTSAWIMMLGKS